MTTTSAQRRRMERAKKKRWRDRYQKLGLRRLEMWVHPNDVADLKTFVSRLLLARGIKIEQSPDVPPSGEPPPEHG